MVACERDWLHLAYDVTPADLGQAAAHLVQAEAAADRYGIRDASAEP